MPFSEQSLRTAAKVSLVLMLIIVLVNIGAVLQTRYQLVSDFIPTDTVWLIVTPMLYKAMAATVLGLAGWVFFFYSKHIAAIIFGCIAIVSFFVS